MTDDDFTQAAHAEGRPACEHHWVSHSQDSALIPWVIRCDMCGAFDTVEMERLTRAHLAAQETYGERAPCGCDLTGPVPPAVHIVDRHEEKQ